MPRPESLRSLQNDPPRVERESFWEFVINHWPLRGSIFYRTLFRLAGIHVGKGVQFLGPVRIKVRGEPGNIRIGDHAIIGKNVDLRNRENGKILVGERVYLDDAVRLVAARDGFIQLGFGVSIGRNTTLNSGGETRIGDFVMIGANVNVNSSSHGMDKDRWIKEQPHQHGRVDIGNDAFIGAGASVLMNSEIGEGAIVSSNTLVSGKVMPFTVVMGVPARAVRER